MVKHSANKLAPLKKLIILLLGPLFSLIIASLALWIVYSFNLNGFLKLFTLFLFLSAIFDLRNIYPNDTPILLYNGSYTYCDGFQISRLIRFKAEGKKLLAAYDLYNNKNYEEANRIFEKLNPVCITQDILNLLLTSFIKNKNFNEAKIFLNKLLNTPNREPLDANNLCNVGLIESYLGNNELAMKYYNNALELDNDHLYSLGNRSYTYNLFEQYEDALLDFNYAIKVNPEFAYAYSNRAFTKIKLGLFEDALADVNTAMAIGDNAAYAYRSLGIYYLETGDYISAMKQLKIAHELDPDTHMIGYYIQNVEKKLIELKAL